MTRTFVFAIWFLVNNIYQWCSCVFICPTNNGFYPNNNDQHSFYSCSNDIPYLIQCPSNLVWHQEKLQCDWIDEILPSKCQPYKQPDNRSPKKWLSNGIPLIGKDSNWGSDLEHLGSPFGIFVDKHKNAIYVADSDNSRVQKYDLITKVTTTVAGLTGSKGSNSNQLQLPRSVYVDRDENIYIADTDNNRIQLWLKGAREGITVAGGNGKGKNLNQIGACQYIWVDESENNTIYISDFYNDRVVKWIPFAETSTVVAGGHGSGKKSNQLSLPRGIYLDKCKNLYIADLFNHRIQLWMKDSEDGITVAGGNGQGNARNQLYDPWDVKVDEYGNVFVADATNKRIQKWEPNASEGETVVGGKGWGSDANQFKEPVSLDFDSEGNLYISDFRNHRIQRFQIDKTAVDV
ncbi:unnamed protein product [Didymodactylos carnosus]|uniref:Chitin-binding type-2 domain-containing protein n=1 Tax=Didymodactylos carnosus TaxID=1234261 RepID=A0A814KAW2_9BILA|nr:unnamed protein product [Didymodactylos carnosus]CAF1048935.1 unnamed protein product [Didymodactylos carnosus]CAF3698148.1 unnamed protein product [Didymodactylos carnosus]CAF3818591.1 unnamed protein product [Didymodactylos carnosus]